MLRSLGSVICNSSFSEILLFCIPGVVFAGLTELNSDRSDGVQEKRGFQSAGGRHRRHNLLPLFATIFISRIDVFLKCFPLFFEEEIWQGGTN